MDAEVSLLHCHIRRGARDQLLASDLDKLGYRIVNERKGERTAEVAPPGADYVGVFAPDDLSAEIKEQG
jgi:hypothetical protein